MIHFHSTFYVQYKMYAVVILTGRKMPDKSKLWVVVMGQL